MLFIKIKPKTGFRSILKKLETGSNFQRKPARPLPSMLKSSRLPSSFEPPKMDEKSKMLPEFSMFLSRLNVQQQEEEQEGHSDSASEILKKKTSQVFQMGKRSCDKVVSNVGEMVSNVGGMVSNVGEMVNNARGSVSNLGERIGRRISKHYIRATTPSPTPEDPFKTRKLTSARNNNWSQSTYSIPTPLKQTIYWDQSQASSIHNEWMDRWSKVSCEKDDEKPEVVQTEVTYVIFNI